MKLRPRTILLSAAEVYLIASLFAYAWLAIALVLAQDPHTGKLSRVP